MSSTGKLIGQRVLITGAGRGIGRAIAKICSDEGAELIAIASRTRTELDETASLLKASTTLSSSPQQQTAQGGSAIEIHVADVTNKDDVDTMVKSIVDKYGGIDILVNNAGGSQPKKAPFETLDSNDLLNLLNLNVVSVHIVTSAVLKYSMLKEKQQQCQDGEENQQEDHTKTGRSNTSSVGRIINISSRAGKVGIPTYSFYVSSKFALEGLTASLAEELSSAGSNIRVNTLGPGMVNTRSFPKPEGRPGVRTAESVKDGLLTLLDSDVTGHYLNVDELDIVKEKGLDPRLAIKPINEPKFSP